MAAMKEVLVVYRHRRRPIIFELMEDPKEERVRLLEAVKVAFSDVFETGEGAGILCMQTKSLSDMGGSTGTFVVHSFTPHLEI